MRKRGRRGRVLGNGPCYPLLLLLLSLIPCWVEGHQILLGRCYSYCLQTHLLPDREQGEISALDQLPKNPIRVCQRDPTCKWCLYVCERPEDHYTNAEWCLRDCRYTRTRYKSRGRQACTDACGFLGRASAARGGSCPAPHSLNGFESACVTSCRSDGDCDRAEHKCCSNDCGSVCIAPYDVHILPAIPANIDFKLLKSGAVMIKWGVAGKGASSSRGQSGSSGRQWAPVVYILRWWCPYTRGAITSVTDKARTKLQGYPTGIYPGSKCHFMVAAVNRHGSKGFSKVSPYTKQFVMPSQPLHLDKAGYELHDGKVDVIIQWQPPIYTDGLPVYRYQVSWSDSLPRASPHYMRLHMNRRTLNADANTFTLHSLEPGAIYFVQVRAVVRWKEKAKRGKPASAYIQTYSPPQPANEGDQGFESTVPKVSSEKESAILSVSVNQTFFHEDILKAAITWELKPDQTARKYLIYWRLETCARNLHRKAHHRPETSATSHERRFTLYNLQPDCEYVVRVHPVNRRGRTGPATVTSFLTPPCHAVTLLEGQTRPLSCNVPDPPGKVEGLHSETSPDCRTLVRWRPPSQPPTAPDTYDVMWGETEGGSFSKATVIYLSAPRTLSVPGNTTVVYLEGAERGQHYTVQVTATVAGGTGPAALLHTTIPRPDPPCTSPADTERGQPSSPQGAGSQTLSPQRSRDDVRATSQAPSNVTIQLRVRTQKPQGKDSVEDLSGTTTPRNSSRADRVGERREKGGRKGSSGRRGHKESSGGGEEDSSSKERTKDSPGGRKKDSSSGDRKEDFGGSGQEGSSGSNRKKDSSRSGRKDSSRSGRKDSSESGGKDSSGNGRKDSSRSGRKDSSGSDRKESTGIEYSSGSRTKDTTVGAKSDSIPDPSQTGEKDWVNGGEPREGGSSLPSITPPNPTSMFTPDSDLRSHLTPKPPSADPQEEPGFLDPTSEDGSSNPSIASSVNNTHPSVSAHPATPKTPLDSSKKSLTFDFSPTPKTPLDSSQTPSTHLDSSTGDVRGWNFSQGPGGGVDAREPSGKEGVVTTPKGGVRTDGRERAKSAASRVDSRTLWLRGWCACVLWLMAIL